MALRTLCPLISNLSQHALTTFQSGIISPSSSISPVCPHLSCRSPDWFHSNTLLSSCLAPAFLSFPGLPLNLYLPCAASHTVHHSLFSPTPVALAQTVVSYDLSVCTCVSQWGYFTMLMNSFQGKFSSVSQPCFVRANVCVCGCVRISFSQNSAVVHSEYKTPSSRFHREKEGTRKITRIVSPLPSPAAETLRSDWEHCAHMSHALVTAVGDGEMGWWSIRDGGVERWLWWSNFTAVAAVETKRL